MDTIPSAVPDLTQVPLGLPDAQSLEAALRRVLRDRPEPVVKFGSSI